MSDKIIFGGMMMKETYQIIKELREDNDIKQLELANYLEITNQQYSLYETGKREFRIKHIKKLCKYFDVSADYILGLTDKR